MNTATEILVVFLGAALLIFLILGIVAASLMVRILRDVRTITHRVEETTENLSDIAKMVGKRVAPVALSAAIAAAMRKFKSNDKD